MNHLYSVKWCISSGCHPALVSIHFLKSFPFLMHPTFPFFFFIMSKWLLLVGCFSTIIPWGDDSRIYIFGAHLCPQHCARPGIPKQIQQGPSPERHSQSGCTVINTGEQCYLGSVPSALGGKNDRRGPRRVKEGIQRRWHSSSILKEE